MMKFTIQVIGAEETRQAAARVMGATPMLLDVLGRRVLISLRDGCIEFAPKKTGKLKSHIVIDGPRIWANSSYSESVRFGAKPRDIYPRHKKALWWPGLPHPIRVAHWPGIRKPNDYADKAFDQYMASNQFDRDAEGVGMMIDTLWMA